MPNRGLNTGNRGLNTGNRGLNTGNRGLNTGNRGLTTGNRGLNTASLSSKVLSRAFSYTDKPHFSFLQCKMEQKSEAGHS